MNGFALTALFLALSTPLATQGAAPELRGSGWVNSREISLERIRGKAVVLYFFEET